MVNIMKQKYAPPPPPPSPAGRTGARWCGENGDELIKLSRLSLDS